MGRSLGDVPIHVCRADLEDELIRALGVDAVEAIVEGEGEGQALRTFRRQPAQRGRPRAAQLRRFLGTRSGRKIRYGTLLGEALDPARSPAPVVAALASAGCTLPATVRPDAPR